MINSSEYLSSKKQVNDRFLIKSIFELRAWLVDEDGNS